MHLLEFGTDNPRPRSPNEVDISRPHAAAATSQAIFHVTKLREMLEGKITPEVWNRLAHEYSSTIYTSNRELGDILMHQPLSIEGKINTFIPKFRGTHARLEKLYDELR